MTLFLVADIIHNVIRCIRQSKARSRQPTQIDPQHD